MNYIACVAAVRRWPGRVLLCLFSAQLAACGGSAPAALQAGPTASANAVGAAEAGASPAAAAAAPVAAEAGTSPVAAGMITSEASAILAGYSVVNISADNNPLSGLKINRRGQIAFAVIEGGLYRSKFFNGMATVDIGSLGGNLTVSSSLNDAGQVTGASGSPSGGNRAFLWSATAGMSDLGTLGGAPGRISSSGQDINNKGQVVGTSTTNLPFNIGHPFLWSKAAGMIDLGIIGTGGGVAFAINDKEQVAGDFETGIEASRAFYWTRAGGMVDLGTLGGAISTTVDINAQGVVVGNSSIAHTPPEVLFHAFTWTPAGGMLDLGTLGGTESNAAAINGAGQVVGIANNAAGLGHAYVWSKAGGMADLGTLGGTLSRATAINDHGQVVGLAYVPGNAEHAFVWCKCKGMVDLNSVIPRAPAGLLLTRALAISADGQIVVSSNAGLVLLKPGRHGTPAPVVGPISTSPDPAVAGADTVLSVHFTDMNVADTHSVVWSWGDGSADSAGTVVESGGAGVASGTHVYAPGIYRMSVTVTDSTGRSASAGRYLEVN